MDRLRLRRDDRPDFGNVKPNFGRRVAVVAPPGTEGARILLGSDAVDVLGSMRVTLAGAGGIGREVLRLLALAGIGKCRGGRVDVVDAANVFKHDQRGDVC